MENTFETKNIKTGNNTTAGFLLVFNTFLCFFFVFHSDILLFSAIIPLAIVIFVSESNLHDYWD